MSVGREDRVGRPNRLCSDKARVNQRLPHRIGSEALLVKQATPFSGLAMSGSEIVKSGKVLRLGTGTGLVEFACFLEIVSIGLQLLLSIVPIHRVLLVGRLVQHPSQE